ncbi:MAG: ATP synthase subunit I [Pseudomonadota bacterium]
MIGKVATTKVIALQAAMTIVVGVVFFATQGPSPLGAVAFGGALAVVHAWLLGRRVQIATEAAKRQPGSETTVLYIGAIQRFVVTLVGFVIGMGLLKLAPVPLLIAFAAAQVVFFLSRNLNSIAANSAHGEPKGG